LSGRDSASPKSSPMLGGTPTANILSGRDSTP
jgi:hypothetical protein